MQAVECHLGSTSPYLSILLFVSCLPSSYMELHTQIASETSSLSLQICIIPSHTRPFLVYKSAYLFLGDLYIYITSSIAMAHFFIVHIQRKRVSIAFHIIISYNKHTLFKNQTSLASCAVILKGEERELILKRAIDVARSPARRRDENEANASMLHGRGRRSPGATILHCILKDYVALLIHAVKRPYEETPVLDSDQHSAVYQFLHKCHRARLRCLGFFWCSTIWTFHHSC